MSLLVVSPCFYPDESKADLMRQSAFANGLSVRLYGVGEPFIPHGAHAQVLKLFETLQLKPADTILVTDCRDAVFAAGEEEILEKFKSCGKDLMMSTEQGCWPPDEELTNFFYGKDPNGYNFINAGQYIGTWEYIQFCLEHLLNEYRGKHPGPDNSQAWWMWALMRRELDFALDSECRIFQTMSGGADTHLTSEGRPLNVFTGSYPCCIHFNGNPSTTNPHAEMYRRLFG